MIMDSLMITNITSAIFPITHCDQSHHKTHLHRKLAKALMLYLIQILELKIPEVQPEVHLEIDQSVIDHPHREWFQEVHREPVGEENNVGNVMRNRMLNALHLVNMSRAHQVMKECVFIFGFFEHMILYTVYCISHKGKITKAPSDVSKI